MYILTILITLISKKNFFLIPLSTFSSKNLSLRSLTQSTVYGNSHDLNYYYSYLYLGEEKKKQSYILDTGSSITTSPCTLCESCGQHENEYFKINENNIIKCFNNECSYVKNNCNYKENDCEFSINYSEGSSISGKYIKDNISFGDNFLNEKLIEFPIGCTNKETYLFLKQFADGIMGLDNTEKSFVSILFKKNFIKNNIFSLCFDYDGGFFSIGEIFYESHLDNNISYINIPKSNFYQINIINIEINGKIINVNNGNNIIYNSIIDSGTTVSYFPFFIINTIIDIIKEKCNKDEFKDKCGSNKKIKEMGECFIFTNKKQMNYAIYNIFPNISFFFQGNLTFIWEPKNYYFDNSKKEIMLCFGFIGDHSNRITLGTTFMKGYDFIFNSQENKIGYVKANCSFLKGKNNLNVDNNKNNISLQIIFYISIIIISILFLIILIIIIKKLLNFACKKYSKVIPELNQTDNKDTNIEKNNNINNIDTNININFEEKNNENKENEINNDII